MKKIILVLSIVLLASTAHAERWIQCVDTTIGTVNFEKPLRFEGDCKQIGLCTGNNNTGLIPNVFEAKGNEWNDARQSNAKCDQGQSEGSRITTLTAQEISDIQDAQNSAADSAVRESAKSNFDGITVDGLAYKALVETIIDEINILRQVIEDISLEDALITDKNLPDRTLGQAKTAIKNKIDAGDVDVD